MASRSFFLLAVLLANLTWAQDAVFLQKEDSVHYSALEGKRNSIVIHGTGLYDSNSLNNEMMLGLLLGRELDREMRERSQGKLGTDNRMGYFLEGGFTYRHFSDSLFGQNSWGWQINAAHSEILGVKFTEDLYDVLFFGNAHLEDQTAFMDGSDHYSMKYQKFGFGFFNKNDLSSITLSVVNGQQYARNDLRTLSLYTAVDGVYLDLELTGTLEHSDSSNTGYGSSNGLGAALDLEWNIPFRIAGRESRFSQISLAVSDLGFVAWNGNSHVAKPDTALRFEGVGVEDIFDLDGLLPDGNDLLDSIGIHMQQASITKMLPVLATVSANSRWHKRWRTELGVRFRAISAYLPYGWLHLSYIPMEQFRITLTGAYGGFGGPRIGLGLEALLGNCIYAKLSTSNALGSAMERNLGAQISFGLGALF